jgi:hypothetical protein
MAGVGSISSGLTGVLPVANGGTGQSTLTANKVMVGNGTSGVLTPTEINWDNTNKRLYISMRDSIFTKTGADSPFAIQANSAGRVFSAVARASSDLITYLFYKNNGDSLMAGFDIRDDRFAINSYANSPLRFAISDFHNTIPIERMRLTNTGRLGIGTTNPLDVLHVVGGGRFEGGVSTELLNIAADEPFFQLNNNFTSITTGMVLGSINFRGSDSNISGDDKIGAKIDAVAQNNWVATNNSSTNILFYTHGNGTGTLLERMRITSTGNVGIGQATPTAVLHLKAGTSTASTAPLKFTSGTNLTTAEAGAMEFNGTNLFFSPSTTRHTVNHGLTGSATLDFPSTTTLLSADLTITVTGAADGDVVSLGVPNAAVNANTSYSAWVSAANTVTVRFNNYSSGTVNPASGSFKVFVTK